MSAQSRMSPWTAFFLGVFGFGAVAIASTSAVVLYGMRVADDNLHGVLEFAGDTLAGLPEIVDALPPAVGDLLNQRRAPAYAARINVAARLLTDDRSGKIRPILTITNKGDSMVSLLAVRVAALDESGNPRAEWTEVVATPIAADGAWRGPIMPGGTRNVIMRGSWHGLPDDARRTLTPSVEISDLFLWESGVASTATVNAG